MSGIWKFLIEPDFYEMKIKAEQMQSYFSIIWNFSTKLNSHIKVIFHLILNLVESEDNFQLEEQKLEFPKSVSIYQQSQEETKTAKNGQIPDFLKNVQNDFQKLFQILKKGENNSEVFKNLFEKLLNEVLKQKQEEKNFSIHQSCRNQSPDDSHFLTNNDQLLNQRKNHFPHSVYVQEENLKIQWKIDKVKKQSDDGLQKMVQKMIEMKSNHEQVLEEKENMIKSLKSKLRIFKKKRKNQQQDIIQQLEDENRLLKQQLKTLKNNNKFNYLQKQYKQLQKDNKDLQQDNKELQQRVDQLCNMLERKECDCAENEINQDILNCLVIQAQKIENN